MGGAAESTDAANGTRSRAAATTAEGVVVLGAGRSGTSAITRAFVESGFFAGREEERLGPRPSNPLGHYEPLAVLEANEELLEELGCSWWAEVPPAEAQVERRAEAVPRLKGILESLVESAEGAPVAIKEPRINALLPLWAPVIEGSLHPVLAVRDPVEVALSQQRRDETSTPHVLASWEVQTTQVLEWLNGRVVTVAPYALLTAEPQAAEKIVRDAATHLDPSRAGRVDAARASSAVRPDLRREKSDELVAEDYLTARQASLWAYLRGLPLGDVDLEVPEEHRHPSAAARAAVESEGERVRLRTRLDALGREHDELCELHAALNERAAALEGGLAEARHVVELQAHEVAGIRSSASWRVTAPLRRLKAASRRLFRPGNR